MEYTGSQYDGETKDGRLEGDGVYVFPSGTKYKGSFKDGVFHGNGTLHFKNGKLNCTGMKIIDNIDFVQICYYKPLLTN